MDAARRKHLQEHHGDLFRLLSLAVNEFAAGESTSLHPAADHRWREAGRKYTAALTAYMAKIDAMREAAALKAEGEEEPVPAVANKRATGLWDKFSVQRTDGKDRPGQKHDGCYYFVLDTDHDPHAKPALLAYANSCELDGYVTLARELRLLALPIPEPPYPTHPAAATGEEVVPVQRVVDLLLFRADGIAERHEPASAVNELRAAAAVVRAMPTALRAARGRE